MKKVIWFLIIISQLLLQNQHVLCQNRWVKSYFGNMDTPVHHIVEAYDKGYLMVGKYGANYSKYNWLIKTDINGDILWEKTIGDGENAIVFVDMAEYQSGNIYLAGSTLAYDPQGDPLIMKLNPCGEKEWCRIFYTENNNDFISCLTITPEGDIVVVLNLTNPEPWLDRLCLAKLSSYGELVWKHCYTSADTSQRNEDSFDLILTPDKGFLITGFCYYEDPVVPNLWSLHPYFLKTDSLGNFEWETVLFKETDLDGGIANNTILSPNGQYFYSSISHSHYETNLTSPALAKLDMQGNVVSVYDVVYGFKHGKLSYAQFLNDSILAASAGWGNTDDDLWSRAVIIDTLGDLLNSTVLMEDLYTSILDITYDCKLVYASNTYQNNQFDFYLTKLNQKLEDDTIYTIPFTYDSLCPYQIVSDTIMQDDCGLIVGIEEQGSLEAGEQGSLEVWPNPTSGVLSVKCLVLSSGQACLLSVVDIFGREVLLPRLGEVQGGGWDGWTIDVTLLPHGIYFISITENGKRVAAGKFVVVR